jgi:succinate-semialdehyde dehydrogenase/glutarate-semialdehyde dehydrogenase
MPLRSVSPATGVLAASFAELTDAELERRLARAAATFPAFRRTSFAERAAGLRRAAEILDEDQLRLGRLMTEEMGKPVTAAIEEAKKCAWACRHYADNGERLLADEVVDTGSGRSFVRYQPLGPILAVMPWNFPLWQVFRFAAPALMAGNVGLLKHASNVPRCALAIEDIFERSGLLHGAFQTLLVSSHRVRRILEDDRVRAATLTGSEDAGAAVASIAGRAIKKTVLELGGSDPFIVLPSADLERAIAAAITARTINNGQSCIAAKRFIVAEPIAEPFVRGLIEGMKALRVGDPLEPATQIGPLATAEIRATVDHQVQRSVELGARLLLGGVSLSGPGYFYPPTVLAEIPPEAPAYHEEVFGPVALVFRVPDLDAAIRLANDSNFGLGASAWTRDPGETARLVDEIEAGLVFINGAVASDPRLPFGGVKRSGYGRELGSHGIREFCNAKTVWIRE